MRSFDEPVIFVGGSEVNWKILTAHSEFPIIAVDGGGNSLFEHGLNPNYVCGDFDSISKNSLERLKLEGVEVLPLENQNLTDFAKALETFDAPAIYAYGFLDGRVDHALDALAQIGEYPHKRIYLIGMNDIAFVFPSKGEMQVLRDKRVSLWTTGNCEIQSSHGLKWPIDGMRIEPGQMSISNQMVEDVLKVDYVGAPLIAICPVDAMRFY